MLLTAISYPYMILQSVYERREIFTNASTIYMGKLRTFKTCKLDRGTSLPFSEKTSWCWLKILVLLKGYLLLLNEAQYRFYLACENENSVPAILIAVLLIMTSASTTLQGPQVSEYMQSPYCIGACMYVQMHAHAQSLEKMCT